MSEVKVKVLKNIPGWQKDQTVVVETDKEGTPLDLHWRRRFRDAKTDNCIEIDQPNKQAKPAKKTKSKQESSK